LLDIFIYTSKNLNTFEKKKKKNLSTGVGI
jgi:hypothetical protein